MTYTHLQVRSGYSLFNSTITVDRLVERAKELEFSTLALTDEEVLYGVVPFYKACIKQGIKPLIGMVLNITINEIILPLVLLAKTNDGYKNIMKISSYIQMGNECTFDFLATTGKDVLCIISTESSELKANIIEGDFARLNECIAPVQQSFQPGNVYIGLESYDPEQMRILLENAKQLQEEHHYEFVALHDVRYVNEKDNISYTCLQAMKHNEKWDMAVGDSHHKLRHLRSTDEMETAFGAWPELIQKTKEIADACHVTFDFDAQLLPEFPVPEGETASTYLRELCMNTLHGKYNDVTEEVTARLDYELKTIESLGFSDYFLIVADFVQFAKDNDIIVGPGRGSAAGSIVSYLLGITNVDPLKYDLLFERFLNPERVTMPDIDIDFSDVRREEVINYVREKYGQDHVAQIITFGTFAARSLMRELMKTMEINEHDQAYILKNIPVQASEPIVHYINKSEEFAGYIKQSKKLRILFAVAIKLEGLPRHISTHAAGLVIGKSPLLENVPLTKGSHDTFLTQYAMHELEAIGLLKIDILGLRNLSMIERIVQSIKRTTNVTIDINDLPENDAKTFALLQKGQTNGVFQLESSGMKNVLTELKPTSLEDIIAVNALYRPGPMDNIPTYIARKHGNKTFAYIHPDLEPILNKTYGVLIYQEQIMQIAHEFAHLSLGEADILRRAVSEKNRKLIDELKERFINGCIKNGYKREVAEEVFSWIISFANYGFNKSHSVAYSKIAYQLSYLKANYPTHFFAQSLSSVANEPGKLATYVREANEIRIDVLPPSINQSQAYFTVEGRNVRIGLMAIKGIGYETVKDILAVRKDGVFHDLFDFCQRVRTLKKNALETLILAGTFDETYPNRASLLASIDQALERAELFGDPDGQSSLFGGKMRMRPAYIEMEDFSQVQKLTDEKELLHMYVTSHPLKTYRSQLAIQNFSTLQRAKKLNNRTPIKTVIIVQAIRKINTKRGDSMAFMTMADETDEMEAVIFPDLYRDVNRLLAEEETVCLEGKISERQNKKQIVIDRLHLCNVEELIKNVSQNVYIRLQNIESKEALAYLDKAAKTFQGDVPIIIYNALEKKTYKLGKKYTIDGDNDCIDELKGYFGDENVVLK